MLTPATIDATARECLEMHRTRARYRPLAASVRAAPLGSPAARNSRPR